MPPNGRPGCTAKSATGTVRTLLQGSVAMLPGFTEGQWWVQDAAAALPARLFGDIAGKSIADLCAAPGGKTAQLAQAGARVTAVDRSPGRMARLRDDLERLSLRPRRRSPMPPNGRGRARRSLRRRSGGRALLVDRHRPPPPRHRLAAAGGRYRRADGAAEALAAAGGRAAEAGGTLVYCTCSLEPEEGEQAISALLATEPALGRVPIEPGEVAGHS